MKTGDLVAAIRSEGDRMATAAVAAGADALIPTCPEWCMRDLVRHQGEVHRWATAIVRDAIPAPGIDSAEVVGPWPSDDDLVPWFLEGCNALVDVLNTADPALECFAFLPAPSPLAFWARRQAHETGVHRVDAQSATGSITPFAPDIAVDGIEEMLYGFASRSRSKLRSDAPRTLALRTSDTDAGWVVHIGADAVDVTPGEGSGDCTVLAAASDVFLVLWNRGSGDGVDVTGDRSVLDLWHETMQIRWR